MYPVTWFRHTKDTMDFRLAGLGRNVVAVASAHAELLAWRRRGDDDWKTVAMQDVDGKKLGFPIDLEANAEYTFRVGDAMVPYSTAVAGPEIEMQGSDKAEIRMPTFQDTELTAKTLGFVTCRRLGEEKRKVPKSHQSLTITDVPADSRCLFSAVVAADLRPLGAPAFFWDTSPETTIVTPLHPPTFHGAGAELRVVFDRRRRKKKPISYDLEIYENGAYRSVYCGSETSVDVSDLGEQGKCLSARVTRSGTTEPSPTTVLVFAPPPPTLEEVADDKVRVTWSAVLDVTALDSQTLDLDISLEVASGPALGPPEKKSRDLEIQEFRRITTSRTSHGPRSAVAKLAPGTRYRFRTRITTSAGTVTSGDVEITRKPSAPAAPGQPRVEVDSFVSAAGRASRFLRIHWNVPQHHGIPVDRYVLQKRRRGKKDSWSPWRTLYDGPQCTFGDESTLNSAKVRAQYRVKASSPLGWSPFSDVVDIDVKSLENFTSTPDLTTEDHDDVIEFLTPGASGDPPPAPHDEVPAVGNSAAGLVVRWPPPPVSSSTLTPESPPSSPTLSSQRRRSPAAKADDDFLLSHLRGTLPYPVSRTVAIHALYAARRSSLSF